MTWGGLLCVAIAVGCGAPTTRPARADLGSLPGLQRLVRDVVGCDLVRVRSLTGDDDPFECTAWRGPCNCAIKVDVLAEAPLDYSGLDRRPKQTEILRVALLSATVSGCPEGTKYFETVLGLIMAKVPPTEWVELRAFATTIKYGMPATAHSYAQGRKFGPVHSEALWYTQERTDGSSGIDHSIAIIPVTEYTSDEETHHTIDGPPNLSPPCRGPL